MLFLLLAPALLVLPPAEQSPIVPKETVPQGTLLSHLLEAPFFPSSQWEGDSTFSCINLLDSELASLATSVKGNVDSEHTCHLLKAFFFPFNFGTLSKFSPFHTTALKFLKDLMHSTLKD